MTMDPVTPTSRAPESLSPRQSIGSLDEVDRRTTMDPSAAFEQAAGAPGAGFSRGAGTGLDQREDQQPLDSPEVPDALGAHRARPRRSGIRPGTRLRRALDHALGGTRSEAERVVRRILRQHRLRGFSFDHPVSVTPDAPPIARLDVAFPAALVAIEIDGYEFHSTRAAFERDRDRQNQLAALGWVTLRFTWTMLVKQPDDVAARIRAVLSARSVPETACRAGSPGTAP